LRIRGAPRVVGVARWVVRQRKSQRLKPLKIAFVAGFLVLLANACSLSDDSSSDAVGGSDNGGSAGATVTAAGSGPNGGSPAAEAGGSGQASGGGAMESAGAGGEPAPVGECASGDKQSCWALEDGTPIDGAMPAVALGSCHIGERYCGNDLKWGACLGAVGPKSKDSCDIAGNDDDCDGVPNHGCTCVDGSKRSCGTDVGACVAGQQTCVAQAWGACEGEVTAQALDSCVAAGADENCNGVANENCPCIGSASEACGDCGSRTCNPATRQWGACQAAQPSVCTSSTQVKDCSAQGNFVASTCQYACVDGQCTGACVPGETRCVTSPERRQTCTAQGVWSTTETCANGKLCQGNGASCVAPCAGQKACANNVCVPLGGCCSDAECGNNFACVNGTCSTTTCQAGFNGPCGGVCTKGCCSVNDCADRPNMGRTCNASHQCTYACKSNYGNCDGNDGNGCEVNLIVGTPSGFGVSNCGSCGNTCNFVNDPSRGECKTLANSCAQAECLASFKPVGDPTDEYAYKCSVNRPHATLKFGDCDIGCAYDCQPGYTDCNYSASDGCETPTAQGGADCNQTPFWGGSY
jgi:hypothetical protein